MYYKYINIIYNTLNRLIVSSTEDGVNNIVESLEQNLMNYFYNDPSSFTEEIENMKQQVLDDFLKNQNK